MATPLRIKSRWFKEGSARSPEDSASAMAFIAWRVAVNMVKRLREAGFDVDAGPAYFGVVREVLVFLLAGIDRMAFARLGAEARVPFTAALVRKAAATLSDNETDLLGPIEGEGYDGRFIDQFNALAEHYAEFGWSAGEGPDFGFMRYLGSRLEPMLPEKDRRWVIDQVLAAEAPEAVGTVLRAMADLYSSEPRRARRASTTGE